jgi:hypothetical protein
MTTSLRPLPDFAPVKAKSYDIEKLQKTRKISANVEVRQIEYSPY